MPCIGSGFVAFGVVTGTGPLETETIVIDVSLASFNATEFIAIMLEAKTMAIRLEVKTMATRLKGKFTYPQATVFTLNFIMVTIAKQLMAVNLPAIKMQNLATVITFIDSIK